MAAHLAEVRSKPSVVAALDNQPILVAESDSALVAWVEFGDVAIPEVHVPGASMAAHVQPELILVRELADSPRFGGHS